MSSETRASLKIPLEVAADYEFEVMLVVLFFLFWFVLFFESAEGSSLL